MALTTTPLIDEFNGSLGTHWNADGGWYSEGGVLLTDGNAGSTGSYFLDYETGEQEQHVEITVINNGSLIHAAHVHARYTDPDNTVAAWVVNGDLKVRVKKNGSSSQKYNSTLTGLDSSSTYKLGLKVIADNYYLYLNGELEDTGTLDGLTGTKVAIQSNDSNTNRRFDDFRVALSEASKTTLTGGKAIGSSAPAALSVNAGDDVSQNIETEVTLTASPTYTGDGTVSYLWSQTGTGTSVTLPSDLTTQSITFTLPNSAEEYDFEVQATDGTLTATDSVTITATEVIENPSTQITLHYDGDSIGNYIGQNRQSFVDEAATLNCTATATNSSSGGHFARTTLNGVNEVIGKFTGVNDLVVIQLGTNDERDESGTVLSEPEYTEQFVRCLAEYTARVVQAGGKVALTAKTISANEETNDSDGTGSRNQRNKDFIRQYNPQFWDFVNEKPLFDYFFLTKGGHGADPIWFRDSYHPSDYGAQQINEYTAEQIVPLIPIIFKDTGITIATNGNQTVERGASVVLDATGTVETDFNAISYEWSQYYGEAVSIVNLNNVTASFTAPPTDQQLIFKVRATINGVDFEEQFVIISVSGEGAPVNQSPTANAGPNQSVVAGTQFTLNGTGSRDTDGTIVEWRWTQTAGDTVALDLENPSSPRAISPSKTTPQTLTFSLVTVDDAGAVSSPDEVDINVAAVVQNDVLDIIDKISFTFEFDGMLTAFPGRANRETFRLKPSDPTGLVLEDGYFDFSENNVSKVEISVLDTTGVRIISTESDSIIIERSRLHARMGDIPVKSSTKEFEPTISVFVGDDKRGVVMTAPGLSGGPKVRYYATTARAV